MTQEEKSKINMLDNALDNATSFLGFISKEEKKQKEIIRLMPEIKKISALVSDNESSFEASIFCHGFVEGVDWRMNKVWHSTSEEPEVDRHCIIEVEAYEDDGTKYTDYVSSVWSRFGWTEDYLELIERRSEGQYKITRWAYVEDLLPNKEE